MRTDDAKKLPLDVILSALGYAPVKRRKNGMELWYASPFREDRTPSLHISQVHHVRLGWIWVWKDFGDIGGTVIDFIRRYEGVSVAGALRFLEGMQLGGGAAVAASPAPPQKAPAEQQEAPAHPFTEVRIAPLESQELLGYLARRGIPAGIAKRYVQEVHYRFEGKAFKALAFANSQGGHEMRSIGSFKGTLPPKGITLLHPEKITAGGAVTVFEGFMDYFSALAYYRKAEADTPVIVLNSAAMREQAMHAIHALGARKVHLYLDRDETGGKLVEQFREALPGLEVLDHSGLYEGVKDFNEFWVAKRVERVR